MNLEDVLEKTAYARPGSALAAFKDAALPIYVLTARVLTLEKKPISPIEEACLRAVEAELSKPEEICGFLGLSENVLKATLASLNSREQINYIRPIGHDKAVITLTSKGHLVLREAKTIQPGERTVRLVFDPLLKRVVFVAPSGLF